MPGKRQRQAEELRSVARRHGYEPGDYIIKRLADMRKVIDEWEGYLDAGTRPPHLMNMNDNEARAMIREERASLAKLELEVLPYFFPKLKSADLNVGGDLSLLDVLKSGRDTSKGE